ncbi:hypothetical protein P872_20190 [Rhodonellum psychrophilum GCM71 = DSM 17998]|uniref:Baseplate protein J-like domain-containing protein n=2 Tax=Rhodonellum TaxID=336827 RepID=U5BTG1_9BACT|nr:MULTISPECIES: hypothetical protein [Rhodonellum]ERM81208.1 hypothetical protein P872_20190 [Rhodonellum psychrophilum GCM71 = DSM 17998]SDZ52442.1 hypothetical protein SAMN05444412_12024 [Rhodonellum ikkaensis]
MNKGISQNGRLPKALESSYFSVDEHTILDMVQFTLKFSESIHYFSFDNKPSANWKPFFLNDPVFVIGLIAGAEIQHFKSTIDSIQYKLDQGNGYQKKELEEEVCTHILSLAAHIVRWSDLLEESNFSGPLLQEINNILKFLEGEIVAVLPLQKKFSAGFFGFEESIVPEKRTNIVFSETFKTVYKNILFIKEKAAIKFETELFDSKNHHPHIGLLIAFFKLFQEIQNDTNNFTKKHLDFYYKKLLSQNEKPVSSSFALIGIHPNTSSPQDSFIPAGQKVRFTFSNKLEVDFETLFDTQLSQANISEIRTLYQSVYDPFSGSKMGDGTFLNVVYDSLLYKDVKTKQVSFPNKFSSNLPVILGEGQSDKGFSERTMWESSLGLAVSSPVLIVEQGGLRVVVSLSFSANSLLKFKSELLNLQILKESGTSGKNQGAAISERERIAYIKTFLREAFQISFTGQSGWKDLDSFYPNYLDTEKVLEFSFELDREEEKPVPYQKEIHGEDFDTEWPLLKIVLNNQAQLHPYKPLRLLEIEEVSIEAQVTGVEKMNLSNQFGDLDQSNPFQAFGPLPSQGSYLRMRNPLIFQKFLSELVINYKWSALPQDRLGFKSYYSSYPYGIDNASFVADITLQKGKKQVVNSVNNQKFQLFESEEREDGTYLNPYTTREVNLICFDLAEGTGLTEAERNRNELSMLITLIEPSQAFGHHAFPELYANASIENSRFKRKNIDLPKQPYTPVLEHLLVDYKNQAKENLSRENAGKNQSIKLFHLHPFGHVLVYPASLESFSFLLPQLDPEEKKPRDMANKFGLKGNLFIGLEDVRPNENINLGFELESAVFQITAIHAPKMQWAYLDKNKWLPMGNLLMEDSTVGFLQSGVVKIKIPNVLTTDNTRLPKGKFWLRIFYEGETDLKSRIKNILINALIVRSVIPTQSIKTGEVPPIRVEKTAILHTNSSLLSFGPFHLDIGQDAENEDQFYLRTSELLRHKNRASSTWDFERLVLEKFPEIGTILVYGRSSFPNQMIKGTKVQVLVTPKTLGPKNESEGPQMVPFVTLLKIKDYLSSKVSPYARFEVSNPVFEKLKVRCSVKFNMEQQSGYFRDLLVKELIDFLSSDSANKQGQSGFLQSIYKSEILNFMEARNYVAFVRQFSVLQIVEAQGAYNVIDTAVQHQGREIELLRTISPYAILTSAKDHHIEVIYDDVSRSPVMSSIGDLSIDSDFVLK